MTNIRENKSNVPAIRFEGFTDSWEKRKLGDLVSINSGRDYKHLSKGTIPVYGTGGYMLSVNEKLSDIDGIGIGRKGTINSPFILRAPFWTVDTLFYALPREEENLYFLFLIFAEINWHRYDESTGVPSLSKRTIEAVEAMIAGSSQEEEKIGAFFANIDNLIAVNQRKGEKLKDIKKALLQKMFVSGEDKTPAIRFEGFTESWEKRKLGDVATFINGRAYKQSELLPIGKYRVLRVGNFNTNDSWYFSDLELPEKNYVNSGDLVYTWSATFGPHIWKGPKVIFHYHIWKIEVANYLDKYFLLYVLDADKQQLLNSTNGSTMVHVTKANMESKNIFIATKAEQRLIAALLVKLDNLIAVNQRKTEALKKMKQALLQQMFV